MKDVYTQIKDKEYKEIKKLRYLTLNQLKARLTIAKKHLFKVNYNNGLEKRYGLERPFDNKIYGKLKEEIRRLNIVIKEKEGDK